MKTTLLLILVTILTFGCSNKETNKILLSNSCSDTLVNVLMIEADINYGSDGIPMPQFSTGKFSFSPQCPFFDFNSKRDELTIYSLFADKDCEIDSIKTLVHINYKGTYLNKGDFAIGYLYSNDTLLIRSIGLLGGKSFKIISYNSDLYIESEYDILGDSLNVEYKPNYNPENSSNNLMTENYKFNLIKNKNTQILTDGYVCE